MAGPSEDDREAVDRVFAEMMAGYHLTAERPELSEPPAVAPAPPSTSPPSSAAANPAPANPAPASSTPPGPDPAWSDQHPLFRMAEPVPVRQPEPREVVERYVPDPLPPLQRPGIPALLGWIGIGFAVLTVLVATVGVRLPGWLGWLAVGTFITGFAILITRLPRNRPPDAGDGAVL